MTIVGGFQPTAPELFAPMLGEKLRGGFLLYPYNILLFWV
jgi:hypothetical protein